MVKEDNNPYEVSSLPAMLPLDATPVSFPLGAFWVSLAVMLPWPILGIWACLSLSLFEKSTEAIFMFGSVTMFFLCPLGFVVDSELVWGVLVGVVWLFALLLPLCFRRKSIHPRFQVPIVLIGQSLFSAIQAGLGFLVVLGKQI